MKTYITLVFILFYTLSFSQVNLPMDKSTGLITYSEVINLEGYSKTDLYLNAKNWFSKEFKSANNVVDTDDKEIGIVSGKGMVKIYVKQAPYGNISFIAKIELKENKYKYTFTHFSHSNGESALGDIGPCESMFNTTKRIMGIPLQKAYDRALTQLDIEVNAMVVSLKNEMSKKQNNDW